MKKTTNKKDVLPKPLKNLPAPVTRQELITQKARQLELGEITARDFADELKLNDHQFKFAELYSSMEHLADGTQAAMIAYNIDPSQKKALQIARDTATRLENHIGVCTLINALLTSQGWNEENVRKQHMLLLNQNADKKMKFMAVKLWYEVNNKLNSKQEISVKHSIDTSVLSMEELISVRNSLLKMEGKELPNEDFTDFEIVP